MRLSPATCRTVRRLIAGSRSSATLSELAQALPEAFIDACTVPQAGIGYRVVSGLIVDAGRLGPTPDPTRTPAHWVSSEASQWDTLLAALALRLGRPLTWPNLKGGKVVTDIAPSPEMAQEQSGSGSSVTFGLHTEDAFHPRRADLLILATLRNPQETATYVSSVRDVDLDDDDWLALQRHRVPIFPDESYLSGNHLGGPGVATVWHRDDHRCLRFDRVHTAVGGAPEEFQRAHARLARQLEERRHGIVLAPGELLVLDNDVVVHGRAPFTARYDARDRWLKRVLVRVPGRYRPPIPAAEDGYGEVLREFAPPARAGIAGL